MVRTPRFLTVRIGRIFEDEKEARKEGYKEPTHYRDSGYDIINEKIWEANNEVQ